MGRHVILYMVESDEQTFIDFVLQTGDVALVLGVSASPEPDLRSRLPSPQETPDWATVYLWNSDVAPNLTTYFLPTQRKYAVDQMKSYVIKFSRCRLVNDMLASGRIWAEFTMLDQDRNEIVPKVPAFSEWYERIATWIRKNYKHVGPFTYAGGGAQEFQSKGGLLD